MQVKPGSSVTQSAKIQPLRKGKVPEWAASTSEQKPLVLGENQSAKQSGLKFTGFTGDQSGIIIDTSKGQKTTEILLMEQDEVQKADRELEPQYVNRASNRAEAARLKQQ